MPTSKQSPFANFAVLWICAVLTGGIAGGLINTVNGWICFSYFYSHLGELSAGNWTPSEQYGYIIQEGALLGIGFGLIIAPLFSGYIFAVSRASCPLNVSSRFLPKMFLTAIAFWLLGGLTGAAIGAMLPQLATPLMQISGMTIIPVDAAPSLVIKWLWVGCSIRGAYLGMLVALTYGCVSFNRTWQKMKTSTTSDTAAPE